MLYILLFVENFLVDLGHDKIVRSQLCPPKHTQILFGLHPTLGCIVSVMNRQLQIAVSWGRKLM
jgi:hypothetical protein